MPDQRDKTIDELVHRLGVLAMHWRRLYLKGKPKEEAAVIEEYHSIFAQLWALGWDGRGLLPDSELPDRLMPKYFLDRWKNDTHTEIDFDDIRFTGSMVTLIISSAQLILNSASQITELPFIKATEHLSDLMKTAKNIQAEASQIFKSRQEQNLHLIYRQQIHQLNSLCDSIIKTLTPIEQDPRIDNIDKFIYALEVYKRQLKERLARLAK